MSMQKEADKMKSVFAVFSVDKGAGEDVSHLRVEIHPIDAEEDAEPQSMPVPFPVDSVSPLDLSLSTFLSGSDCIQGDFGWWKYEFCYGKYIIQYHVEKDGSKTVMNLGNFHKAAHIEWLQNNPHKRPDPSSVRTSVSHFYSGGTVCAKTGKPRHTEVKLKCLDGKYSQGSVSLYLLEPKVCQYILVVESKEICKLLSKIDVDGLYEPAEEIGFSKASYKNGYQPYSVESHEEKRKNSLREEKVVTDAEKLKKEENAEDDGESSTGNDEVGLESHISDGDE